ncbi:MAG: hypothetical protein HYW22_02670 [Candidatus Aenigmarchaeota archaeon]|nr:hypothetical protein [Candidatus Aenigmarchaeota archaeon]
MKNIVLLSSILLIVFLAGCTQYQNSYTQPASTPAVAPTQTSGQDQSQQTAHVSEPNVSTQQQTTQTQQSTTPTTRTFSFEVDDNGYYSNGEKVPSVSVNKSDAVTINFLVRTTNVYSGGLELRGCDQTTSGISPGKQGSLQFTASSSCTITGYWPSTNIAKSSLQVSVA